MSQLFQGLRFNLPYPLSSHSHDTANFLESQLATGAVLHYPSVRLVETYIRGITRKGREFKVLHTSCADCKL